MAAGYVAASKQNEIATFEMSIRRLPRNRDWVVIAGMERAIEYLLNLRFEDDEIEYLRGLRQFAHAPAAFFDHLQSFRFTGDVDAVPEGTVLLAGEPVLTVSAPILEAQIPETYLLSAVTFETLIATKAARLVDAAQGKPVLEFGTRRAHTPEAGTIGARAAYIGGCVATSNTLAGYRYGIPVAGTSAHSWVMSFQSETEAFCRLQQLMGDYTVQLIDTYDALEGARKAGRLGKPLWGVRIDSGDLLALSREVRSILDAAGLQDSRIMASGDLNEERIAELLAAGAPLNSFGVGTELATSADAPAMGMVYKVVELEHQGRHRYTAKRSLGKMSVPGAKQIWRFEDHDVVTLADEKLEGGIPLFQPMIRDGERVNAPEDLQAIRDHARRSRAKLTKAHAVERSPALEKVLQQTVAAHL